MTFCALVFLFTSCASKRVQYDSSPVCTPTNLPPPVYPSQKNQKPIIVLDAGHGGDDFGTHSHTNPKYHEKNLNLATTIFVRDYLEKLGYEVKLTRSTDCFIELNKRADFANKQECHLFVSVHYNSAPSKNAEGVEIYYFQSKGNENRCGESKVLANDILSQIIQITNAKSRGVRHGNFAVIRETKMPAVLVECGFVTNQLEMNKIKDSNYQKLMALAIAKGIDGFVKGKRTS